MPGLIDTQIDKKNPVASIKGYAPETIQVDKTTDTMQGQLQSVLAKDNPLMQGARTRALQGMAQRGLINSTMAQGAAERAMYDVAMPIAQYDAGVYGRNKEVNMFAKNRAHEFTAGAQNQGAGQLIARNTEMGLQRLRGSQARSLQHLQGQQQMGLQTLRGEQETGLQTLRGDQETGLQTLRGEQAVNLQNLRGTLETNLQTLRGTQANELAHVESAYRLLINASDTAADFYTNTINNMNQILASPDIPIEQKEQLISKNTQMMEFGLALIGGINNLDLTGLLDFSGADETQPEVTA